LLKQKTAVPHNLFLLIYSRKRGCPKRAAFFHKKSQSSLKTTKQKEIDQKAQKIAVIELLLLPHDVQHIGYPTLFLPSLSLLIETF
jgi:hypothetical protein